MNSVRFTLWRQRSDLRGESTIIGGQHLSLAGATILNGYLVTAVTMCDVHLPTLTHVTPEVVPPALALAERDDLSGRDLLVAIVAGCEVMTRIGLALDYPAFRKKGWHGPGVTGPFGAAAAAGKLLGLDTDAMVRAFGLAGSQAAGTFAAWGTPTVKFHQCRAALSGLMAGLLAQQGFVATREFLTVQDGGLFTTYAEGGLPDVATRDLGRDWELQRIALRMWPSATALQPVVTALLGLVRNQNVSFPDIARVRLGLGRVAFEMHGRFARYQGKFEALLSAHYVSAVFLRDRKLTLDQFEPSCCQDPVLRQFAAERVEVVCDERLANGEVRVTVTLKEGGVVTGQCEHPLGSPDNPLSVAQTLEKLRLCAGYRLNDDRPDKLVSAIKDLASLPSSRHLTELLRVG